LLCAGPTTFHPHVISCDMHQPSKKDIILRPLCSESFANPACPADTGSRWPECLHLQRETLAAVSPICVPLPSCPHSGTAPHLDLLLHLVRDEPDTVKV
ncbi:hypothetical protein LEMLEM_LOCUS3126, partial [Lemmus lemmus]